MTWTNITGTTTISASRAVTLPVRFRSEPIKILALHPGAGVGGTLTIWDENGRSVQVTRLDPNQSRYEAEFYSDVDGFNYSFAADGNGVVASPGVSVFLVSRPAADPDIVDGSTSFAGPLRVEGDLEADGASFAGLVQAPSLVVGGGKVGPYPHRKRPATSAPFTAVVTGHTSHDSRTAWYMINSGSVLYLVFRNWMPFDASLMSNERDYLDTNIGDITVSASVEIGGTYFVDAVFANGARTAVIPPGGEAVARVIGPFNAGSTYFVRTHIDCTAGKQVPAYNTLSPNTGYLFDAASIVRSTGTSGYTVNASTPVYGPSAVYVDSLAPTCLGYGDSILRGVGDTTYSTAYGQYAAGWFKRWLNGKIGSDALGLSGATLNTFIGTWGFCESSHQAFSDKMASGHLVAFGANDCLSKTFATITSQYTDFIAKLRANGATKIIVPKILPRTTSTDSWATVAKQTPVSGFEAGGIRDQVNAWFVANSGTGKLIDIVLDTCTAVEDPAGNKWKASNTADGAHPNSTAHANIAVTLPNPLTLLA